MRSSTPATSAPASRSAQTTPRTYDAHPLVVPGLSARDQRDAPDVMRGEETQILGALKASGYRLYLFYP